MKTEGLNASIESTVPPFGTTHAWLDVDGDVYEWLKIEEGIVYRPLEGKWFEDTCLSGLSEMVISYRVIEHKVVSL